MKPDGNRPEHSQRTHVGLDLGNGKLVEVVHLKNPHMQIPNRGLL
jgi:hypothetical protein